MNIKRSSAKIARVLLMPINASPIIFLGIYTIIWGVWLANPFWSVFTHAALYSTLAAVAPEWFWGCIAILVGFVTTYGAIKRHYSSIVIGASTAAWHWLMITIFYFIGDPLSTGGITALLLSVYAAYVYLNIKVNFGDNKHSKRLLRLIYAIEEEESPQDLALK